MPKQRQGVDERRSALYLRAAGCTATRGWQPSSPRASMESPHHPRRGRSRMEYFTDRAEAGRRLAARLLDADVPNPVVLGLPRGGVPVAAPVAVALGAPLDVLVVRKLGVPG